MQISTLQLSHYKHLIISWANQFPYCLVLDNCQSSIDRYGRYEYLVGVADENAILIQDLASFETYKNQWLLGGLSYDLKNEIYPFLAQSVETEIDFGNVALFVPQTIISISRDNLEVKIEGNQEVWQEIFSQKKEIQHSENQKNTFESNFSKSAYLQTIHQLINHIIEGDFYEINLSQRFLAKTKISDVVAVFEKLIQISPVPFATFFKWKNKYVLGASPERFLQLHDNQLVSQPIKGTIKRGKNQIDDEQNKKWLANSEKERAENIMIVDLTRNDLYKSAEINSVKVPYLFEIQTFPTVHQLVSTVTAQKKADISTTDILKNTFPPGSMTGAPKVMTMQMIDKYETVARGMYSGSIGYFAADGSFDLNVVIRSIIYDADNELVSYHVGGAIVYDSEPNAEYEETLVKAKAIQLTMA